MQYDISHYGPCRSGLAWYESQPDAETAWKNCHRGDWMLWVAYQLNVDHRILTLTKGYCAKTVIHLMTDNRSKQAVETAIKYGEGQVTKEKLVVTAAHAAAAAAAAYAVYAIAADAADDADDDAAYAAAAAAADADAKLSLKGKILGYLSELENPAQLEQEVEWDGERLGFSIGDDIEYKNSMNEIQSGVLVGVHNSAPLVYFGYGNIGGKNGYERVTAHEMIKPLTQAEKEAKAREELKSSAFVEVGDRGWSCGVVEDIIGAMIDAGYRKVES